MRLALADGKLIANEWLIPNTGADNNPHIHISLNSNKCLNLYGVLTIRAQEMLVISTHSYTQCSFRGRPERCLENGVSSTMCTTYVGDINLGGLCVHAARERRRAQTLSNRCARARGICRLAVCDSRDFSTPKSKLSVRTESAISSWEPPSDATSQVLIPSRSWRLMKLFRGRECITQLEMYTFMIAFKRSTNDLIEWAWERHWGGNYFLIFRWKPFKRVLLDCDQI